MYIYCVGTKSAVTGLMHTQTKPSGERGFDSFFLTTAGLKNLVCKLFGKDVVKSVREK